MYTKNKWQLYILFLALCQCLLSTSNVPGSVKGYSNIAINILKKTYKRILGGHFLLQFNVTSSVFSIIQSI